VIPAAAWFRVSTGHQTAANQVPDVERFAAHRGYEIGLRYELSDTAWKNGGGKDYQRTLKQALAGAHAGKFKVLIVWALDRVVRDDEGGAEAALRIIRRFRQAGVTVVSVQEPWLNGAGKVQDVLVAFAGWVAERESPPQVRADPQRAQPPPGRGQARRPGAVGKKKSKRSGYVACWEDGARRAVHEGRMTSGASVPEPPPDEGADR